MSDPGKHRARDQWGPREVIALVIILGSFTMAGIHMLGDTADRATIPAWVATLVAGVGLYYYKNGKP